jgi:uncharacterized phage protein gp47/JayE
VKFQKNFDELLSGILTDYQNQFPAADISQGSLLFIKSACMASALWGLYRHQDWIARQIFPDTADTENLELHAWRKGQARKPGETDEQLLERHLAVLRNPPAGGNKADYETWAREVATVARAWCLPLRRGTGTVDVLITADADLTGSEIPDAALLAGVLAYIEERRPVGMAAIDPVAVLAPTVLATDVEMTVTGEVDLVTLAADVAAYLALFVPGQTLYPAQLTGLAVAAGAENVVVAAPAAPVVPTLTQMIRAGVVDVA